jgi:hypothetical protein
MNSNTWEIFKILEKDQISINYLGDFKDHNTDFIINLSESNFEHNIEIKKLKKKVSFLIAESFQNIVRHGEEMFIKNDEQLKTSSFFSIRINEIVQIISANAIDSSLENQIKEMIEKLNSYSSEELKVMYLDILTNSGMSEKGGAGLGLIEMARKSGQKLDYFFEKINEKTSLFYLQIKLNTDINQNTSSNHHTNSPLIFRNHFLDEKIMFAYKGEFSRDSVLSLLSIIENNIKSITTTDNLQKKSFIILVELLQNISKHGLKTNELTEGIFTVSNKNGQLSISTGNWISTKESEDLIKFVTFLNSKSFDEIKEIYREKLSSDDYSKHEGAGVGLINIIRFTKNKIIANLHDELNENKRFVTITITL